MTLEYRIEELEYKIYIAEQTYGEDNPIVTELKEELAELEDLYDSVIDGDF